MTYCANLIAEMQSSARTDTEDHADENGTMRLVPQHLVEDTIRVLSAPRFDVEQVQLAWASLRMVSDCIEELFGWVASMESEEATLMRGPELHHYSEAIIAALQRVKERTKPCFHPIATATGATSNGLDDPALRRRVAKLEARATSTETLQEWCDELGEYAAHNLIKEIRAIIAQREAGK